MGVEAVRVEDAEALTQAIDEGLASGVSERSIEDVVAAARAAAKSCRGQELEAPELSNRSRRRR